MAVIAVIAVPGGAWLGPAWGLALACAGLLLVVLSHVSHLWRLQSWLRRPEGRDLPDAWGAWGDVYMALHRLLRRQEKERERIAADLEVFSQAAEAYPDGLVFLDADDRILWCNRAAEGQLGLDGKTDRGLLVINAVRAPGLADLLAGLQPGETLAYRPAHQKGACYSLEAFRFGTDRKLLTSFDVTQIERVATVRRDFVANVSHELRTPLTVLAGFLELMNADPDGDGAARREQLGLMDSQVRRMLSLVDDLLTLSRLESAIEVPREEMIDVRELGYDVAEEARGLSGGRHVITCEVPPVRLRGSREELRSAFSNLVSNAVRYTPAEGRILLRWSNRDGKGVFSVEDSGIGIAEEHIPRLTERFYRVDRGRSRESGGTGLGLSIVRHVLLRHQADLEIQSVPGVGSTFSAVFPAWRLSAPGGTT